ncbi:MAG: hypothetical protein LBT62_01690 [Deltaproteobacteria bacterium]|jgi:hypothetical protein|nr:hypothetical protein [Deltaproteobacteria bacterium]
MSDTSAKTTIDSTKVKQEEKLDRKEFFKQIRNDVLTKIGLPQDTKPEQVLKILEIQSELEKIKIKKRH